jgi:hypothetical protein
MLENKDRASLNREPRKKWDNPHLVVYGDMTALTQSYCPPGQVCKLKVLALGDDFAQNTSTLG